MTTLLKYIIKLMKNSKISNTSACLLCDISPTLKTYWLPITNDIFGLSVDEFAANCAVKTKFQLI